MFTTCIHCTADLGRNEAFEIFPVGTRLAFDAARGRLWVVCRACDRWNLSPLDERWEAVEAAEQRFRDSRLRVSTGNIGLARLREGVDLIRIGEPQRPEMAAWRYGDQFGRRRKRQLLITGALVGAAATVVGAITFIGVSAGSTAGVYANGRLWDMLIHGKPTTVVARIPVNGTLLTVQRRHARMSAIERVGPFEPFSLRIEHTQGTAQLVGADALRAAAQLMPTVNRFGGSARSVNDAVAFLEAHGGAARVLTHLADAFGANTTDARWKSKSRWGAASVKKLPGVLHALPQHARISFEMALHEESERRAMDGELADLEKAWREAEEIAKIADDMFVTPAMQQHVETLRLPRDNT